MKTRTSPVWLGLLALGPLAVTGAAAQVDTAAVQRCRTIPEAPARLACYDAIALPGLGSRAGWGAPTAAAPAPAAAPGTTAARASTDPAAAFGFEQKALQASPDRLDSRVVGLVQEFRPGTRLQLENGQVWQVTEPTNGFYNLQDPKVSITRGAMGNFLMSIEGANATPRVRRVQ
jgi:hypothetical protein